MNALYYVCLDVVTTLLQSYCRDDILPFQFADFASFVGNFNSLMYDFIPNLKYTSTLFIYPACPAARAWNSKYWDNPLSVLRKYCNGASQATES